MLVLSRNIGESIKLGDDITVTVVGLTGKQVRLGISAPKDVNIAREELLSNAKELRSVEKEQ